MTTKIFSSNWRLERGYHPKNPAFLFLQICAENSLADTQMYINFSMGKILVDDNRGSYSLYKQIEPFHSTNASLDIVWKRG